MRSVRPAPAAPSHDRARSRCPALRVSVAVAIAALFLAAPAAAQQAEGKRPYYGETPSGKPPPLDRPPDAPAPERTARPGAAGQPSARERASSTGTGFLVADGRLLTNNHVLADCTRVVARNAAGRRARARVDATDAGRDLAVLTVPADFGPPLPFRSAPPIRRGELVVTYGFPLSGLLSSGPTLTTGDVSALAGLQDNPVNLTISAPVQPGNSGGPLLDAQANVVGVVVSKLHAARVAQMTRGDIPQNVNFAVKGDEALAFLRAHGVQPRTERSDGADRRAFEVGEVANASTVFLQCFR